MPPADKTKRQAILEAAAVLFRDKGYNATSMRDLAQAVQLQASSLYNHIQSKQDLLREICFNNAQRFLDGIIEIESRPATAAEKVEALIELHVSVATQDLTSITAFNDEWRHLEEPHLNKFKSLRREYENRFKAILAQGMQDGDFRKLDPQFALYTLLSALRWVHDWRQPGRRQAVESVRTTLSTMLLNGLRQS
jgi:AcrR family transcriptional regulator